jgi:RHS repeat-associated protein
MNWLPGYNAANRYALGGTSYDANGNVLNDTAHIYTWDANGNMATADSTSVTYDAFGRMVENSTGSYTQFLYLGDGQTQIAAINGSSTLGFAPMLGGGSAIFSGGSIAQYNHPDWLGSARLITSPSKTLVEDTSFAPYGEAYGGNPGGWMQFTEFGRQNTIQGPNDSGLNDFLFRRYSSTQSRWISPDPAGMGAVDPTNPQTWNRYAYVANNPLSATDPLGLFPTTGFGGGEGGGGGGCDPDFGCDPGCDPDFGCDPNPCEQGCVAGGDSPSAPPPGPTPGPLRRNPNWSTETLGLPGGLHLQPLSLANLLGLSPGTECDFGVCAGISAFDSNGVFLGSSCGTNPVTGQVELHGDWWNPRGGCWLTDQLIVPGGGTCIKTSEGTACIVYDDGANCTTTICPSRKRKIDQACISPVTPSSKPGKGWEVTHHCIRLPGPPAVTPRP